jgi:hypothetical protein
MISAEAAAEQRRLKLERVEEYEEMDVLLKEQEARLAEQEGGLGGWVGGWVGGHVDWGGASI